MRTFEITVSGKTLSGIINSINEVKKRIEAGASMGFDSNEDEEFSFDSNGKYEDNDDEDES